MDQILIAEDLLLLVFDDESGKPTTASFLDVAIGGALLVELSLCGAVELTEKQRFRQPKVVSTDDAPPLPPLLAQALAELDDRERVATSVVTRLGKNRRDQLLEQLVERGILRREDDKLLGLFPRTRWPAEDSQHETEVRRKIDQALIAGHTADERTAALIALLSAMGIASKVADIDGMSSRQVNKQAKQIAEGDWASAAVRDAVTAAQVAVIAGVTAASAAAT